MYACMSAILYLSMCIYSLYKHIHIHFCVYIYMCTYMCTYIYICICTCALKYTHVYVCIYTYLCLYSYIYICIFIFIWCTNNMISPNCPKHSFVEFFRPTVWPEVFHLDRRPSSRMRWRASRACPVHQASRRRLCSCEGCGSGRFRGSSIRV